MPPFISIIFIIALISALFPSADGAMTALTSSLCIDIFGLKEKNISITDFSIVPENLGKLILLIKNNTISSKIAKDIFEVLLTENKDPELIVQEKGLVQITDNNEIEQIVDKVISENSQSVEDYKAGKDRALGFLVGQAMKETKGKANPKMLNEMFLAELNK